MALLKNSKGKPMDQWTWADLEQFTRDRLARYSGDSYLVDELVETEQFTPEGAQKEVGDPKTLRVYLESDMLPEILADHSACKGLKNAILERRGDVVGALIVAAKKLKVPKKRGPKGKMVGGQYIYQRILKLKDENGLSWKQIAVKIFNDPRKKALVKAHYHQAKARVARNTQDTRSRGTR